MPDFAFTALDARGRRTQGVIAAESSSAAHLAIAQQGLSPLSLSDPAARGGSSRLARLGDREAAELTGDLASLLEAGADTRAALDLLADRADRPSVKRMARAIVEDVSTGRSLGSSFESRLPRGQRFVSSLVTAGEAGVGLSAGLRRASEMLEARVRLRDQLVGALSYPAFILMTTALALIVITFFVVPALAPLIEETGSKAPSLLAAALVLSSGLRDHWAAIAATGLLLLGFAIAGWRVGIGKAWIQRLILDGPARRTLGALVFGPFAVTLGSLLAGGAGMSEALRLATDTVGSPLARERLDEAVLLVRQGRSLSLALETVRSLPPSIIRLVAVGEASGGLGDMLRRAGKIEEERALRRLVAAGQALGPILVVLLGGLIGLLMAGLLTGVSALGAAAADG